MSSDGCGPSAEEPDGADGGRARLSKRAVVDRALKLADTDGLDALTIRKLAQDLGVTPMALYWHFRSKEDLLEGVAEQVWGEIEVRVDPSVPWWAQLQAGLESLIRVLRAHPSAPQLLLEHEKRNEAALRATEAALEILLGAGFDRPARRRDRPQHAVDRDHAGHERAGYHPELAEDERAEFQRRNEIYLAMLPPARYPHLVRCAAPMANCEPEFHYRLGVELFIAGVRAIAERQHGPGAGG